MTWYASTLVVDILLRYVHMGAVNTPSFKSSSISAGCTEVCIFNRALDKHALLQSEAKKRATWTGPTALRSRDWPHGLLSLKGLSMLHSTRLRAYKNAETGPETSEACLTTLFLVYRETEFKRKPPLRWPWGLKGAAMVAAQTSPA